jgi:dihydropyrimidine dehydrogenase (NAD+) subunit PreA
MNKPNLSIQFCGISSPNLFWLASAPPTNSGYQIRRAFEAGWSGVVWKTLNQEPIVNVSSRYGALDDDGRKIIGPNNIELIIDRALDDNLDEIRQIKEEFPDRAVIVSLMAESTQNAWHDLVKRTEDTGCNGLELNFGCPHGMSERGMGSAVGQGAGICGDDYTLGQGSCANGRSTVDRSRPCRWAGRSRDTDSDRAGGLVVLEM